MTPDGLFKYLFLAGLVAQEAIRLPHRLRNKEDKRRNRIAESRVTGVEWILSFVAFLGMEIVPAFYVLSIRLDFADYDLPGWMGWAGVAAFAAGLWLLWRAHVDLGRNWSPTLEIVEKHTLVTGGVYRYLRHPIYAALWLFGIAQPLMLHNWIAGLSGLASILLVQLLRIPREERMMLDQFGDRYRAYMKRTGGVIPMR